ncbi:MAG: hypothetical protein A2527_07635 [Candidatus Lambdaproteobacteria bacterium RIFOXYD2_FULL_50_16]|uniref:histidine kinase n=1 Tax=Candidatus Lambdaproteobacteria bacterium RIFOXYD2_FULL_50_16 TaxID=1817772 RepID=A0A1F6GB92_9PROT|nr:MAG: hypothetical protein A2527_07635 [Candidatus Lambdaproteobacteria bacterium RIFOXYD2_FULL_50_16]
MEKKSAHLKKRVQAEQRLAMAGYLVPFFFLVFIQEVGLADFGFWRIWVWTLWVAVSSAFFYGLTTWIKELSTNQIRWINFGIFSNWALLWFWTLTFLGPMRVTALFMAFLALIFFLSSSSFSFSLGLTSVTTAGYLVLSVIDFPDLHTLKINLFYGACYFVVGLYLSLMAGYFERQRQKLKQVNKKLEKNLNAKADFLNLLSHEIRTPLNAVIGMTQLLSEVELPPDQKENLVLAQDAAQALSSLVNDILDFSKLESGKMLLDPQPINLPQELKTLIKGFERTFAEKDLDLELALDPNLSPWVQGDWPKLRQVLVNLLSNALKFTPRGQVWIGVKLDPLGVCFEVADTGIGITQDQGRLIFESFTQGDPSITRQYGGTGLGLAIASRMIGLMGGQIELDSQLGMGSRFSFTLDLTPVEAPAPEVGTENLAPLQGLRILLAEDNKANQRLMLKILERWGVVVTIAENGLEAVKKLGQDQFDLILMDLQMPEMDGMAAAKEIRMDGGDQANIPIIALTANAMAIDKEHCLAAGMNDYLTKPVNRQELTKTLLRFAPSRPYLR